MISLEPLRADHAAALLAFELENRAYFAASIPDRGDAYFAEFEERHRALLEEQETGTIRFHVLVDPAGEILGRINLIDLAEGSAELGYRIAEKAAGRGLATEGVLRVFALASGEYGLRELRAVTNLDNIGSRRVLERTGFRPVAEFDLDGRPAIRYLRPLP
ncbi:GNAT family N-acetyltransferase [Bailinhaonella thermotolerans]|uniref:N-acetyltransferase n=1 Tax=Bailinhaonella thermotolerans TaxID=1070861 RepID=A0A3A4ARD9_9ACTN|nr:GNAT family N-acetyltransferase [Bailinhaonella thermotolerans]RJL31671.1 N-acetyltransferase [Bailinhaonella thermotolerans]